MTDQYEMIGLPGAGKTTFIESYIGDFHHYFDVIESRKPTVNNKIRARYHEFFTLKNWPIEKNLKTKLAYRMAFRKNSEKQQVFYYDSGLIQCLFEYGIEHDPNLIADYKSLFKSTLNATNILHFKTPPATAARREFNRTDRRFPKLEHSLLQERYKQAEKAIEKNILPLAKRVIPVTVSADFDLEELLEK